MDMFDTAWSAWEYSRLGSFPFFSLCYSQLRWRTNSDCRHLFCISSFGPEVVLCFELDGDDDESHTIVALGSILGLVDYVLKLESGWVIFL